MPRFAVSLSILGALILGSLLSGMTTSSAAQDGEAKILRIMWGYSFPDDLEPQTNQNGIADLTLLNYEGLTRLDTELNVVPGAAESWEFSPDGLAITFHLRENLTYSDGSPLTAERFRYAIERRCDPHFTPRGADQLFDIVGCEGLNHSLTGENSTPVADEAVYEAAKANLGVRTLDDRTLEIKLTQPAPYFPALTQWIGFIPVKQELLAAGGSEPWLNPATWVGNGPFQVTGIEPNTTPPRITLTRNEHYWGGKAKLDGIELIPLAEDRVQDAYDRGDVDDIYPVFDRIPQYEADPVLSRELIALPTLNTDVFLFNLTREPFQEKEVREAFAYAFDREDYCKTMDYTCRPVLSWIPEQVPGHIETDAYAFNPVMARQALAASSYKGPENLPEIIWYYPSDDDWSQRQGEWLAAQFQQVLGVELTLQAISADEIDAFWTDPDATPPQMSDTYWWSGIADPHQWMEFWTCGNEIFAVKIGYCNPKYDALVRRADTELDPEERIRLAAESQQLLIADAPAIFAYTFDNMFLVKPYVTGYSHTAPNQSFPGMATPREVDKAMAN